MDCRSYILAICTAGGCLLIATSAGARGDLAPDPAAQALRPAYVACLRESVADPSGKLNCALAEYFFQSERLRKAYTSLLERTPVRRRAALREEQGVWWAHKKVACAWPDPPEARDVMDAAACSLAETAARARELEERRP